jgi:hypothetical protein
MVSGSCGGGTDSSIIAPALAVEPGDPLPIDAILIAELGYPRLEINGAVLDAQARFLTQCMSAAGFQIGEGESLTSRDQADRMSSLLGSIEMNYAESALRQLSDPKASIAHSPERDAAYSACLNKSKAEVPSPLAQFQPWLEGEMDDLNQRAATYPQLLKVREESERCISGLGYDASSASDLSIIFLNKTQLIVSQQLGGDTTLSEARAQLAVIAEEEANVESAVRQCATAEAIVLYGIQWELEREFVESNGPAISEFVARIKPQLDDVREYLPTT